MASIADLWERIPAMTNDQLKNLMEFIAEERQVRAQRTARQLASELAPGVKVRVKANVKPKYMAGLTGEVVEFKNSRVLVALDCGPINKFRTGKVLMPLTTIEVL